MGNINFRRKLFFWLDRLQISKQERITIGFLLAIILVLVLFTSFLSGLMEQNQYNYDGIKAEFERKTLEFEEEQKAVAAKYDPPAEENQIIGEIHTNSSKQQQTDKPNPKKELIPVSVNINTADIEELQLLPGVGKTYAERILEYRKTNGNFTSVEELINIKGIGEKRLEKIKPFIKL